MAYNNINAPGIQHFAEPAPGPQHRKRITRANLSKLVNGDTGRGELFAEPPVEAECKFRFHPGAKCALTGERHE
jgi:hypothetical protein